MASRTLWLGKVQRRMIGRASRQEPMVELNERERAALRRVVEMGLIGDDWKLTSEGWKAHDVLIERGYTL